MDTPPGPPGAGGGAGAEAGTGAADSPQHSRPPGREHRGRSSRSTHPHPAQTSPAETSHVSFTGIKVYSDSAQVDSKRRTQYRSLRRRIYTEAKSKVAAVWGTQFIKFLAALAIFKKALR